MNNKDYQEALTNLKTYIVDYDDEFGEDVYLYESYKEEFDLLQELVDKATPKKPVIRGLSVDTHTAIHTCPVCDKELIMTNNEIVIYKTKTNYCDNCGQKLDWSDNDE